MESQPLVIILNLLGTALVLSILAGLSLWLASRRHGSALILAIPVVGFIVRQLYLLRDPGLVIFWIVFAVPLVMAVSALALWGLNRKKEAEHNRSRTR